MAMVVRFHMASRPESIGLQGLLLWDIVLK